MLKEMLSPEEVYVHFARSFPTHSPSPSITWYISFALEKWTLSRNSQLWFFFSDFPCLTWGVQSGDASSLNARRYLQSLLCDFFNGWKIPCPQSQRLRREDQWASDENYPKCLVKSKGNGNREFYCFRCPSFRFWDFYYDYSKIFIRISYNC